MPAPTSTADGGTSPPVPATPPALMPRSGLAPSGARSWRTLFRDVVVNDLAGWQPMHVRWRVALLRRGGITVGDRAIISSRCFWSGADITIGDDAFVNVGCFVDNSAPVRIGDRVALGPGVTLLTGSHEIGPLGGGRRSGRAGVNEVAPVVIEDDCWIGARSTVMPGVRVARGCVVGAGSLVTRSTEPHGVYVGIPARRVRDLPPQGPVS